MSIFKTVGGVTASLIMAMGWPHIANASPYPQGDYDCTPSVIFQFDDNGETFGVAAVLSTDTIFRKLPSEPGATLVYQAGGASYLIDSLEDDFSRFKYRVVYSGDLRTFTGFCKPLDTQ